MAPDRDGRFLTLHEIVKAARLTVSPGPWDYLVGGADSETTLRRNRQALDAVALRPRVLRDVSRVDCTSNLLGRPVRLPVLIAPVGSIETFTAGGGATAARGATKGTDPCRRAAREPRCPPRGARARGLVVDAAVRSAR